jgi:signal transduction histidine kinase
MIVMGRAKPFGLAAVTLVVGLMVVLAVRGVDTPPLGTLLFWTGLLAISELLPVTLGFATEVTMAFPIHLALAILFPPAVAMGIAGLGAIDLREVRREIPLWQALWNRAQMMLAVGAAAGVVSLLGRESLNAFVVIGAALAHLVVNLGLVATMVNFMREIPFDRALRSLLPDPIAGFWASYVLLTALGAVIAVAYREISYRELAVAAILIPLLFARLSILGARAQQELSEKIQKQQQALLEASERVFEERELERHRIAEQIHDSSLQLLAAAAYGAGNVTELIDAGQPDRARDVVISAREAIDAAIKELRGSLVDLRRSSVEEGGLQETVRKFVDQVSTLWGTQVHIEGEIEHEPPIPVALAGFQILQEGLVNALKHAQDSEIVVRIAEEDGMVHLVVEDGGPGFDVSQEVGADHVGMRLMKERAERVGGRIELDSTPGSGTRLEAILPAGVSQ